jgi:3-deoxy-manno-octulosonate cytidylyltransferase (CMP-KDO synthetase)
MKSAIFIPARKGSTRFPNKPLAKISGETLIYRTWKIAKSIKNSSDVLITTDSEEIQKHCESFGAKVIQTSKNCLCGTDRIAQALEIYNQNLDIVFNLQGDAPLTPPWVIEQMLATMQTDSDILMATPMKKLTGKALKKFIEHKLTGSLTGTTVVFDNNKNALYFSKGIIPNYRNKNEQNVLYQHIGLYAYRVDTLKDLQSLQPSSLEQIEGLEQLRALENNIAIKMVEVDLKGRSTWSVDHRDDIDIVEDIIRKEGELV